MAEAGADQSIHAGESAILDGSGSSDDLTLTQDLIYSWSFNSIPAGSSLSVLNDASSISPGFISDFPGDYVISLAVTDENGLSSDPDIVTVSALNVAPVADAGLDQDAIVGNTVTLDGSGSSDVDLDSIHFAWSLKNTPAGSGASIVGADTVSPFFVPDLPGSYTVQLVVNDGFIDSAPGEMIVTVVTPEVFAEMSSLEAINIIGVLPTDNVTTTGNQTALGQFLAQVIVALHEGDNEEARSKLSQAIERTDGCTLRGEPDTGKGKGPKPKKDYITECSDQYPVYVLLTGALAALMP